MTRFIHWISRTLDDAICGVADAENRIVVTKDDDFVYSFLVEGRPARLLLIGTGNIPNTELLALFQKRLPALVESFVNCHFVELTRECILLHIHRDRAVPPHAPDPPRVAKPCRAPKPRPAWARPIALAPWVFPAFLPSAGFSRRVEAHAAMVRRAREGVAQVDSFSVIARHLGSA
ncbi:MAG: DUF5615 family PIN-like protein [Porticoccaceae bacterium]